MTVNSSTPCFSWALPPFVLPAPFNVLFPSFTGGISISFPPPLTVPIPCCNFTLPAFTIQIPVALIIPPAILAALMATINTFIQAYLALLPEILIPNCNF